LGNENLLAMLKSELAVLLDSHVRKYKRFAAKKGLILVKEHYCDFAGNVSF
jgi:hypothetical protein